MSRFIVATTHINPHSSASTLIWVVLDDRKVVGVAMTEDEARRFLVAYKQTLAATCSHPELKATIEGPDMLITAECVVCGMVGEGTFDTADLAWIGQQP